MTKRAICVGINDYSARNDCATLPDARPDGEAWAQLLPDAFGFETQNITLITDQQASRQRVLSALTAITKPCGVFVLGSHFGADSQLGARRSPAAHAVSSPECWSAPLH
jgi:hypothetical protein